MATRKPKDYLNNANLLVEIIESQKVQNDLGERYRKQLLKNNPSIEKDDLDSMVADEMNKEVMSCLTPTLIKMLMLLVDNMATSFRWNRYTWLEDMRAEAHMNLCRVALKFNLEKAIASGNPPNPFSYYTQIAKRIFITIIEKEKKLGNIRDDIIEMSDTDLLPSYARQHADLNSQGGEELDGTKRVESNHYLRRRRKKPKVKPEDDFSKMDDVDFKKWLDNKTQEYFDKQ